MQNKKAASLTGALLARKGEANPASGGTYSTIPPTSFLLKDKIEPNDTANGAGEYITSDSGHKPNDTESDSGSNRAANGKPRSAMGAENTKTTVKAGAKTHDSDVRGGIHAADASALDSPTDSVANPAAQAIEQTRPRVRKKPVGMGERIAMTVRLDHDTHLRLKLFCAHAKLSSQQVFSEALEAFLIDSAIKSDCRCLAKSANAKR